MNEEQLAREIASEAARRHIRAGQNSLGVTVYISREMASRQLQEDEIEEKAIRIAKEQT